jgi:glycerol 2-dehydrogenase (NADP+)
MNPNGNHPNLPKKPDGSRDLDTTWTYTQTWKQMEAVLATGKTKAIGVANFSVPYLEELMKEATITPAANQIENHPYLPQQEIVDYCKEKGILITAYSPLGSTGSPLFEEKEIQEVAKKHDVSPGAVLLSYHGKIQSFPLYECLQSIADIFPSRSWKFRHSQIGDAVAYRGEYEVDQARLE